MKQNTQQSTHMPIRLVALDLDGTTLNSRKEISPRTVDAFAAAMAQGVHVVVSTGRTFQSLPAQLFEIPGLDYVITSNGARITALADRRRIYENLLRPRDVEAVVSLLRTEDPAEQVEVEIFLDGVAYIDAAVYAQVADHGSDYRDADYILTTRSPVPDLRSFMLEHRDRMENISLNFRDLAQKARWLDRLRQMSGITVTSSFAHNLEIGDADTSKGRALTVLLDRLGLTPAEMLACGDSPNDAQMLALAGLGVAVANADAEIRAMADAVTDSNDEDGVAKAIERWVLGR